MTALPIAHDEAHSEVAGQEGHGLLTLHGRTIPARFHPLADVFPMIQGEAFASLVEDVRANGVRRPIVLLDGMILDGRNRYLAAREAGAGYPVVEFTGEDPVAFVVSENIHRRHLTEGQRAMVSGKLARLAHGGDRRSDQAANLPVEIPTQAAAAEMMNVSERSVRSARAVLDHGTPGLAALVEGGDVGVSAAEQVATLPQAEQVAVVEQGPAAVKRAASEVRAKRAETPKLAPANDALDAPAPPPSPWRKGLSGLTREGLEDWVAGLRETLSETKAKLKSANDEIGKLKAANKAFTGDQADTIRRQAREIERLGAERFRSEDKAAKWVAKNNALERKLKAAEARIGQC